MKSLDPDNFKTVLTFDYGPCFTRDKLDWIHQGQKENGTFSSFHPLNTHTWFCKQYWLMMSDQNTIDLTPWTLDHTQLVPADICCLILPTNFIFSFTQTWVWCHDFKNLPQLKQDQMILWNKVCDLIMYSTLNLYSAAILWCKTSIFIIY